MLEFFTEITIDFVEGILILLFFTLFTGQRNYFSDNKLKSFLFVILFSFFCYWATIAIPKGLHTAAIFVFVVVLLPFITGTRIFFSTLCISIIMVIFVICELVIVIPAMFILRVDISIFENTTVRIIVALLSKTIGFLAYFFLSHTKKLSFKQHMQIRRNTPTAFIFFQTSILCIILMSTIFSRSSEAPLFLYQALILTMVFLFIVINFIDYLERGKTLREQYKIEVQHEYVKCLEEFVSTLRKEKHDYANHLNTLNALCKLNNLDALQRIDAYLKNLTAQIQSSYQSFSTGNDYINALLAVKCNHAVENDINFKVNFNVPISRLNIPDSDLISILGNIIDNALEALTMDQENSNKQLNISTGLENGKFCVNISNNGPQIIEKNIPRIFESGFSTKGEKKDRGFGLYIINQIVQRNNGIISVTSSPSETNFQISFDFNTKSEKVMFNDEVLGA